MSDSSAPPLRSLPRVFIEGAPSDGPFELPKDELDKFRKVLRLSSGDAIAVLPGNGSLIRCRLEGRSAVPEGVEWPNTESKREVWIAQALPKADRLETVVRMGTELGVSRFLIFPSRRSVAVWEPTKRNDKLRRLRSIVREAAEQSYRCLLPTVEWVDSLKTILEQPTTTLVLSEMETEQKSLCSALRSVSGGPICLVTGPEGGWNAQELAKIGDRGFSMGPLVYRTDTASLVAAAIAIHCD